MVRRERVADVDGGRKRRARGARGRRRVGVEDGGEGGRWDQTSGGEVAVVEGCEESGGAEEKKGLEKGVVAEEPEPGKEVEVGSSRTGEELQGGNKRKGGEEGAARDEGVAGNVGSKKEIFEAMRGVRCKYTWEMM